MHNIVRRVVRVNGRKSTAVVQCSCGEKFKSKADGMDAERKQFEHKVKVEGDRF